MGDIYQDIYSAGQNCINTQFCADGGSFQSSSISLPRSLKIRVIANPAFWGFGTTGTNTLIEGWGTFNNAGFDFFDGYKPDHTALKDCDGTVTGPYINEQRPDVAYRSVYDPENGDKHYSLGEEDGIVRGGAESYLLDRPAQNTSDSRSCQTDNPVGVFKTNPADYGIAPKILFNSNIYKNITGAWRINECSGCYTQNDGGNDLRNLDCSGAPKQHIQGDENFAELYDPFRNRCISDKFYNSAVGESGCNSDGVIAGQYAGTISSIVRDVGVKPFLKYTFQYDGEAASGIFNGKSIGITATSGDGGALNFFDVQHGAGSTTAYAVGSFGTGDYSNLDGGSWTLFDSYDPNTCCGGVAYGVDPKLMNLTNSPLYHIDIGRVFNNPKNKIYSNRIDRTYNGLTVEPEVPKGTFHTDRTYVAVNEDGNGLLVESGALYEVELACQTGVWSATGDYIYKLHTGCGASAELEIGANSGITYRVTAPGSGYADSGYIVKVPTGILSPEQTFNLTFGPPDTGLLSFTSTPGGPVTRGGTGYPAGSIIPLTVFGADAGYSTKSGICSEALSTDSGFYPLLPKTLPYYGPFDVVDRFDYTERTNQYGNKQTNRNATCYTKQGSLSVYPDCLSQYAKYKNCDPKEIYDINVPPNGNVPRIALVYRGCDFDDICTFDDSGRPWTAGASGHPSSMNDLIRGFAGQEIQMYINLGTARGAEIKREPCCCEPPPCPGTNPPEYVQIPSPVSYPCFPKFDLRPNEYGALDPRYYFGIMQTLGLDTDPSGGCFIPEYPIDPIQPYTTYGYIRNLCGKETNSRRGVIDSLSQKSHAGDYTDVDYTDNTVEPMYVEFKQDTPDCCSPSGFSTGGDGCDPSVDLTTYGEGASGELEIDAAGGITYRVTAAGSGYIGGGNVLKLASAILSPEQTFNATFGPPGTGLLSFTSTPGGPVTSGDGFLTNYPAGSIIPLTIVGGGTGPGGSGGFTYDDCSSQGQVHYWGLTDFQGRLAYPYFRTEPGMARVCGKDAGPYVNYSETGTITKGWPRSGVPFLVEIDHEEYCSSCSTTQMPTGNMSLTITSLSGEYLHGMNSESYNSTRHNIYGWTHNKFYGVGHTPIYYADTDTWEEDICDSGDGLALIHGQANIGHTCECADGVTMTMVPRVLKGTNVPIGYITSGSVDSQGGINSYASINCTASGFHQESVLSAEGVDELMEDHEVYMSANLSCGDSEMYSSAYDFASVIGAEGLDNIYGCSTECATSFPAPNSAPSLNLDFFYVRRQHADAFAKLSDDFIHSNNEFLKNGLEFSVQNGRSETASFLGTPGLGAWGGAQMDRIGCGGETGIFNTYTIDSSTCDDFESTAPSGLEDYLQLTHCVNGNKGKYEANPNINTCLGSRVIVFACSAMKKGVYNRYKAQSAGKWSVGVGTAGEIEDRKIDGCIRGGAVATGEAYLIADKCFADNSTDYKGVWKNALDDVVNNGDVSALASLRSSCVPRDSGRCCENWPPGYNISPPQPVGPFYEDKLYSDFNLGCFCQGLDEHDILYDVTYSELTHPVTSGKTTGWYGDIKFPITTTSFPASTYNLYWSGENIKGIGNIGPLPLYEAIAVHYQDTDLNVGFSYGNGYNEINVEKFCDYHTGPNKYSQVGAEVFEPRRLSTKSDLEFGGPNLTPDLCTGVSTSNEFYANCGTPAPFDTYVAGKGRDYTSVEISPKIDVVRKSVWPEIMTVHKIECESNGYKLHVSREYFEHDRKWYKLIVCAGDRGLCPIPRLGSISGGEIMFEYPPKPGNDEPIFIYPSCADTGSLGAPFHQPPAAPLGILPLNFIRPLITPTDLVGPIYPDESSPCATGTEIFYKTDTDFVINKTTSDVHPGAGSNPSCMYFPAISGEQFWNFYNLFYDSGVPDAKFLSDAGDNFPQLGPVFSSVSEMRNHPHSCVQDLNECGGMLWNNKEFFPRKSYAVNTRIAPFGALSICEQNAQLESPSWYDGHTGKTSFGPGTWEQSPNREELAGGRFVDACDSDAIVLARTSIDIDDNVIYIPGETEGGGAFGSSILALQGKIHPGFTSNLNQKTCVYADSGECLDFWPEHNDSTIRDITFHPDEYGYYLDKLVASGVHDCLFTPFKIMVDVECCPDRIGHKGTSSPTNLNYMAKIPAPVCGGWTDSVSCDCNVATTCDNKLEGAELPRLACAYGYQINVLQSGAECYMECVSTTGEFENLQKSGIWALVNSSGKYFVDPYGGDPLEQATLIHEGPNLQIATDVGELESTICAGDSEVAGHPCQIYDTGDAHILEAQYNWLSPEFYLTTGLLGRIYKFEDTYFTVNSSGYMDVIDYTDRQGQDIRYRFADNDFNGGHLGGLSNCCDGMPEFEIGDSDGLTQIVYGGGDGVGPGCRCRWNPCDVLNAIPFTDVQIIILPESGILEDGLEISPAPPDGGLDPIVQDHYGCRQIEERVGGFYPSAVKINISQEQP